MTRPGEFRAPSGGFQFANSCHSPSHVISIVDSLEHGASAYPDRCLYSFLDGHGREKDGYTYLVFHERTRLIAQYLKEETGLRTGDRALLAYPPGLDIIAGLVACARIGVIPVPVYPPTPSNFDAGLAKLAYVAHDCQAAAALTTRGFHSSYQFQLAQRNAASPQALAGLPWIVTDDVKGEAPGALHDTPHPIALLQYTSGSTTDPRGVVVSHDNVLNNCRSTLDSPPIGVSWLPQYHDMGLIGCYLYPLITGGTTYGFSPSDFLKRPALWLQTISRVRATHSAAPNFAFDYCLRDDKVPTHDLEGVDLSSLRMLMNAAEPVRPATVAGFRERFAPYGLRPAALTAAYGLAENTIAVSQGGSRSVAINKQSFQQRRVHIEVPHSANNNQLNLMSCGRPVTGVEVRIVDLDTRIALPPQQIGEIWTAGPSTCLGYWNRPAESRDLFDASTAGDGPNPGGFLRTGDLGFMHDGELFVCGRIKDLIIIRGVNFYPQDIEAIVESCSPAIRVGCTVAFDAGDDGERLVVVVEARKRDDLPDAAQIARAIRTRYYVEPHTIAFVPHGAIPRTTSGKVSRSRAREIWVNGKFEVLARHVAERSRGPAGLVAGPRQRFQYLLDLYNLTGDEPHAFADVGMDSLTTVEFVADVKALLDEQGAGSLVTEIDARLLQRLPVGEFFALVDRLGQSTEAPVEAMREALERIAEESARDERDCMRSDARLPAMAREVERHSVAPLTDVLLTGATGFFGPFLLGSLLRETPLVFHVLTRADHPAAGLERIRTAFRRAGVLTPAMDDDLRRRVHVVCGDLARHSLGLSEARWQALAGRVQAICHNGACVNYVQNYDTLRPPNVAGTRELIRLAFTGRRKAVHFVSSTFIYGWTAKDVLWEADDNAAMESLDFGYAQSKWVAEQLVLAAGRQGLDVRIYRPSLISAASNGVGSHDDILVRLLAFMITHGVAPAAVNQVSFVPADVVAHNIAVLIEQPAASGTAFNVTADHYYNMVDVAREITRAHGYSFAFCPIPEFVAEMNRRCTRGDPVFPLLDFFNRSHQKIAAMERKRYNNEGYRAARDRSGAGRRDPQLQATVGYLMDCLHRGRLIPPAPVPQ